MGRHTLKTRLILVLLGLAAIPVILLGGAQTWNNHRSRVAEVERVTAAQAQALGMQVAAYLGGLQRELALAVRLHGGTFPDPRASLPVLRRLVADRGRYRQAAVMDGTGIETARVSTVHLVPQGLRPDRSGEDVFAVPARTGTVYVGPVRFDVDDGEPLLDVALPISDPATGRLKAVLHAELRVRILWDLAAAMILEPGGDIYIVDDKSRVIANRNPSVVLSHRRVEPVVGADGYRTGLQGEPVIVAMHQVPLGGRPLTVVAEHTVAEAMRPARESLMLSALMTVLAMIAAVALLAVSVRTVLAPIRSLARAAKAVRDGDYDRQVPVRTDDEMGELADTFNSMTARLRSVMAELRQEIVVRTESEQRFRAIFEQAAVGIALVGLDGRFLMVNGRLSAIVGYKPGELVQITFQDVTHPDDLGDDLAHVENLLLGRGDTFSIEKRYIRKDGAEVWGNLTVSIVRGSEGEPRMFVAVIEDISARKAAEFQLRATVDELSRSNLELERFAYVASHDLQEPLRNVIAFAQMLERKLGDAPELQEALGFMVGGAYRMRNLVQGLLEYSRAGVRQEPFAPVKMEQVLAEVLVNLHSAVVESGATVTSEPLPEVTADRLQMVQLMQNLVGNAIKFRHSERPPTVTVSARAVNGDIEISVADNGIGIDPEYHEQAFVIFRRCHRPEAYPGIGIGLAICRRIIERHGGRIWMEQGQEVGTVVRFTIPHEPVT